MRCDEHPVTAAPKVADGLGALTPVRARSHHSTWPEQPTTRAPTGS